MLFFYLRSLAVAVTLVFITGVAHTQTLHLVDPDLATLHRTKSLTVSDERGRQLDLGLATAQDLLGSNFRRANPSLRLYYITDADYSGTIATTNSSLSGYIAYRGSSWQIRGSMTDGYHTISASSDSQAVLGSCSITSEDIKGRRFAKNNGFHFDLEELELGATPRSYRLVVTATRGYYDRNGGTEEDVKASIMLTIARMNEIFHRDLAVKIILEDTYLSLDDNEFKASSRSNGVPSQADQAALVAAKHWTTDEYDLGMVFHNSQRSADNWQGGVAKLRSVCNEDHISVAGSTLAHIPKKGGGWSGSGEHNNSSVEWYRRVAHELGHMFGADHTFNGRGGDCELNVSDDTAVEIGSGTTLMSYAGTCGDNYNVPVDLEESSYFHTVSIAQMHAYLSSTTCGSFPKNSNALPAVNANPSESMGFTIPVGTAFFLRGKASDPDNDRLTCSWEQIDEDGDGNVTWGATRTQSGIKYTAAFSAKSPLFPSAAPSFSPQRNFPENSDGVSTEFEVLPMVERQLNFAFVVRDNHTGYGAIGIDTTQISVSARGPLSVSAISNPQLRAGVAYTFEWQTNGTDALTTRARVEMAVDAGAAFSYRLAEVDYADQSATIVIPTTIPSSQDVRFRLVTIDDANRGFYAVAPTTYQLENDDCGAVATRIAPDEDVFHDASTGLPKLDQKNDFGRELRFPTEGTIGVANASTTDRLARANEIDASNCNSVESTTHYRMFSIVPTLSTWYEFSFPTNPKLAYTLYRERYDPHDPCAGFVASTAYGRSSTGLSNSRGMYVNLQANERYVFVISTVEGLSPPFTETTSLDYTIELESPGTSERTLFTTNYVSAPSYAYTYLAVEETTTRVAAVDAAAAFPDLPSGNYLVYGMNYPESVNTDNWVDRSLSEVMTDGTSVSCMRTSDNARALNVVGADAAAPVDWLSFTGQRRTNTVDLEWSVASETDNDYFEVERSVDGLKWLKIGKIDGLGTTTAYTSYLFTDTSPLPGRTYYRLRQVDYDGGFSYSSIVVVEETAPGALDAYPNPFHQQVRLSIDGSTTEAPEVYDLTGRRVTESFTLVRKGSSAVLTASPQLSNGVYLLRWGGRSTRLIRY